MNSLHLSIIIHWDRNPIRTLFAYTVTAIGNFIPFRFDSISFTHILRRLATHFFAALSIPFDNAYCRVASVCVLFVYWNTSEFRSRVAAVCSKLKISESINMCVEIGWIVCSSDFMLLVCVRLYCYVCVTCTRWVEIYMLHSSLATAASRFGPQMHVHVCVYVFVIFVS